MTALNLTPASERSIEYMLEAVQCYAQEWRTATMSSRNRESAHARAQATLARIRTMLEGDARKFEESGRAALAQSPAPLPKWIDDMKGADPTLDGVIEYFEGRAQSPVSAKKKKPSSLADQVVRAQAEMATWSPEVRASVRLQGSSDRAQPRFVLDSECVQSRCARPTSGCWGECGLKTRNLGVTVTATSVTVAAPVSVEGLVAKVAYLRQASEFGPWLECPACHPDAVRFVSIPVADKGAT